MSAQAVTKSLRDSKSPINKRAETAKDLLDGKTKVYLPHKETVVLQWLWDVLAQDPKARQDPKIWQLLAQCWSSSDDEVCLRIYQTHRFVQILIDAFRLGPLQDIATAMSVLAKTTVLTFANDAQAGQLVKEYLSREENVPVISKIIFENVRYKQNIFKGDTDVLPILLKAKEDMSEYLQSYFTVPGLKFVDQLNVDTAGMSFTAIVESGVDVHARLDALAAAYPQAIPSLLSRLGKLKLTPDSVDKLVALLLQAKEINWDSLVILLNMQSSPVLKRIDEVIQSLHREYNENMVLALLSKYAQLRQLPDFVEKVANTHWFSGAMLDRLAELLTSLSTLQLKTLLSKLQGDVLYSVLSSLKYAAATPEIKEVLPGLVTDWQTAYAVSALAHGPFTAKSSSKDYAYFAGNLRLKELDTNADIASAIKRLKKWHPAPGEAESLLQRFYLVLDTVDQKVLDLVVSKVSTFSPLFELDNLFEAANVSASLISAAKNKEDTFALTLVPPSALSRKDKADILALAWSARDLVLAQRILEHPPRLTEFETDPKKLFQLVQNTEAAQYSDIFAMAKLLTRREEYVSKLKAELDLSTWQKQCIAACIPGGFETEQLISVVKAQIVASQVVTPSLAILEMSGANVEIPNIGEIAIKDSSPLVFTILCRQNYHWSLIAAYFVFTGSEYRDQFLQYCMSLSPNDFFSLLATGFDGQFSILQVASQLFQRDEKYGPLVSRLALKVETNVNALSEQQLVDYLQFIDETLCERAWLVNQYTLESVVSLIAIVCSPEFEVVIKKPTELYTLLCLVMSRILLYQRHRLNGRMPLVMSALSSLLQALSEKVDARSSISWMVPSPELAFIYTRLIENLCDPPQSSVREVGGVNSLTSSVARVRRYVAQYVGTLLANFVFSALNRGFEPAVRATLQPAVFNILSTLGAQDFKALTASLDGPSRAYLRPIYDEYKQHGKYTKD